MPRCKACDVILTDFEATRKIYDKESFYFVDFVDLCNSCYKYSGIKEICVTKEREDLPHTEDITEDELYTGDYED